MNYHCDLPEMRLSLMSTVYQLAEDVKQYAEIKSVSSGGGANSMQRSKLRRENIVQKRMKIKSQKEERIAEVSSGSMEILRSRPMHRKR
jgi:hypothetical protein